MKQLNQVRLQEVVRTIALVTAGLLLSSALENNWEFRPWAGVRLLAGVGIMIVVGLRGATSRTGALIVAALTALLVLSIVLDRQQQ